jgi:hypothetical protein
MKLSTVPFVVLTAMMWVGPAQAQTAPAGTRVFVASHAGPKWDDLYSESRRLKTPVAEGGVTIGIESATSGVELDLSVSEWHNARREPSRFRYGGESSGYLLKDHFYEHSSTTRRRSPQVSLLFRRNRPVNDTVTVAWLVGGGYAYRPSESVGITREVLPDGSLVDVHTQDSRSTRNYVVGVGGLEATVKLSQHLAVVPRVRFTLFPNLMDESTEAPRHLVVRPQVAVRWTF